jgi:3'-phosphoadenosine 5'-phosphosulfate sulfotransferase
MRKEIKDHISWNYGPKAWEEVLQIEARMRKQRKEELYKKQERIDAAINFTIGFIVFVISGGILFVLFYFLGKYQGRW